MTMNKDVLQGKWDQVKGSIKNEWGDLTDKEIDSIKGRKDQFIGLLREKYGYTLEMAEDRLKNFMEKVSKEWQEDTQKLSQMGSECVHQVENRMKKNVFQTALIAFGIGVLSDRLLKTFFGSSR
jgi:uncharacterized protein YjbJ (UPF0337 family)